MTPAPQVFDATTAAFEQDVIQRSRSVPVLVDFWAAWCGPCRQLGPVLEKLATEYNGAFVLAKVDVDAEQQLAAALQIRSIPTVMLVKDGQLVDGFPGALPEGQVRQFLGHYGIQPAEPGEEQAVAAAEPAERDPQAEVARLREALAATPEQDELKLDLALALIASGETAEAGALLEKLPANLAADDRARTARARLAFAARLDGAPARAELERRLAADPGDHAARHLLGIRLIAEGHAESGLRQLLELLERDRQYAGGLPRQTLLEAFQVIDDAALVGAYRRKMASLLF